MSKRIAYLLLSSALLLFSCASPAPAASSETSSVMSFSSSREDSSEDTEGSCSCDISAHSTSEESSTSPSVSSESEDSSAIESSSEETSSSESSSEMMNEDGVFQFYCVNDFHGAIVEQYPKYYESGIAKYFGKLKEFKEDDPDHTFIFSAGDMFQGSLESNDSYGSLVVDCMNNVGFDAMTIGNHEFDYGLSHLVDNIEALDCPVLGGNIVNYGTTTPWNEDVGISTIIERGGNRLGVVGMIGGGQTTSITSSIVEDLDFVDPEQLALDEAKRLREEEGCSMVIYVIHDDMANCSSYAANKTYFDGVFCGHRHSKNLRKTSGVPFVQSYCNGEAISHFEITMRNGVATCTAYELISAESSWAEDEEIAAIRDRYILDPAFVEKASAPAGTVNGVLDPKESGPNLAAKAIYDTYVTENPNIRGGFINDLRAQMTGDILYRDVYQASPFTNYTVIAKVKGEDILNMVGEGYYFYSGANPYFSRDEFYEIACIDYVIYHVDVHKIYDRFPSLNEGQGGQILREYQTYTFDLLFNYIRDDLGGVVKASDYLRSSAGYGAIEL